MSENESSNLILFFESVGILPDPTAVQEYVEKLKTVNAGMNREELADSAASGMVWRTTGAGVVASLPGAIPGLGTIAQLATGVAGVSAETWLILRNLAWLQMTVAGIYGHDLRSQDRRDELLLVWGLTTGALVPAKEATKKAGTKIAINFFERHVTGEMIKRLNALIGAYIFTKWGTARGTIALGRLLPFGVGALVGGGMNYASARGFSINVCKFYGRILPNGEELFVEE